MIKYRLGGVFQVGDYWHIRYSDNGKQIRETSGLRVGDDPEVSRAKAQKLLQRRLVEIEAGKFAPGQDRVAIESVLDDWLENQKLKGLKQLKSPACLVNKHLRAFFKGYRAARITAPKLRAYVVARTADNAKPSTIRLELTHLHSALVLAVEDGRLSRVPKFPTIKVDNAKQGFVEPADFARFHAELPSSLKDLATFLYWAGWRSNEAKSLTWADVNLGQGQIHLRSANSKNGKGRVLPIFGAVKEVIERRHVMRRSPYVFSHTDGRPLKYILPAWKRAAARAGLVCTPHDFRRSAVRNLVRSGVPEKTAMDWTGHRTRSIFDRYDITSGSDLERAAEKLTAYVSAESAKPSKIVPLHRTSKKLANSNTNDEKPLETLEKSAI